MGRTSDVEFCDLEKDDGAINENVTRTQQVGLQGDTCCMAKTTREAKLQFKFRNIVSYSEKKRSSAGNIISIEAAGRIVAEGGAGEGTERRMRDEAREGWLRVRQRGPWQGTERALGDCSMRCAMIW